MKQKRILVLASTIVALCLVLIATATYALFSDQVQMTDHLQSGTLNITLERTSLVSRYLDDETGYLVDDISTQVVDFSNPTSNNVFGLTENSLIVPGCKYEAFMRISNNESNSSVAYAYWLEIVLNDSAQELANQLKVTVKRGQNEVSQYLTSLTFGSESNPLAVIEKSGEDNFYVSIEFICDVENDVNFDNNAAQGKEVDFDLIVHAIQVTTEN